MPADGISLPFTTSGNVGSSRPEEHKDYKYPPPTLIPHCRSSSDQCSYPSYPTHL